MKKISLIVLLLFQAYLSAQDFVFFSDSPNNTYYEQSSGSAVSPSVVVLSNTTKFPVETGFVYSGANSLRLRWKSVEGGDWGITISSAGNSSYDITHMDSLTFFIYTTSILDSSEVPALYLADINNMVTTRKKLSGFLPIIDEDRWIKISIPLSSLISSPGGADLTKIKSIGFGQGNTDNSLHTIYLDEIRIISNAARDTVPPAAPTGFQAKAYTTYIYLKWQKNSEHDLAGYRIYRDDGSGYKIIFSPLASATYHNDNIGIPPKSFTYRISAFDSSGNESPLSNEVSAFTISLSDSVLLDTVQEMTFKYFWDYAHPFSGLARERTGSGDICAIGGSGFGVMAIPVGIERRYITREEGISRILKILNFLIKADRFHGAFPHWMNGNNGKAIPFTEKDDGADLVETAYMMQGLLTIKQYFKNETADEQTIRSLADSLWRGVDWSWFRGPDNNNFLFWHWSPNYGWAMNMPIRGFNETMITYLLAIASPTHTVPSDLYRLGWAGGFYKNTRFFYGILMDVGPDLGGPLFFTHYSFIGFDPRNKRDAYTNYFINNRNIALIHQAYAIDNPHGFQGYDADTWGLTASDDPIVGYMAHEPNNDDGTITPSAALSSMPYTPQESINALKSFYYEYGGSLIGEYGFKDAFNIGRNWYSNGYIAIDQGPILLMIENYRSGLLWKYFMMNPEIKPMLDAIGFIPDTISTSVVVPANLIKDFKLLGNYPNPFNPVTTIRFSLPKVQKIEINIVDILGRKIKTFEQENPSAGVHEVKWDGSDEYGKQVSSGIYLYTIKAAARVLSGKMILQK